MRREETFVGFSTWPPVLRAGEKEKNAACGHGHLSDTLGRKAAGLVVGLLANLPDPINLIPVVGAAAKGAGLAKSVMHGAKAGALGTALADAVIFPVANERGEDFGIFDAAMDLAFGAVLGGFFGAGGYGLRRLFPRPEPPAPGLYYDPHFEFGGPDRFFDLVDDALRPANFDRRPDRFFANLERELAADGEHAAAAEHEPSDMAAALEDAGLSREDAQAYAAQIFEALAEAEQNRLYM